MLKELGINPATGGAVIVVSGTCIKNAPWDLVDEQTKQHKSGHSFHVAYFGGTIKVNTDSDSPLRKFQPGDNVLISIPCSDTTGRGMKQAGQPTIVGFPDATSNKAAPRSPSTAA